MSLDQYFVVGKSQKKKTKKLVDEDALLDSLSIKHPVNQKSKQEIIEKISMPWLDECVEVGYLVIPKIGRAHV